MMLSNLAMGSVLVAIVLGLFLNLQVARWVMVGIPVSFPRCDLADAGQSLSGHCQCPESVRLYYGAGYCGR